MDRAFSHCGIVISVRPSARDNGFPEGLKLIIERCSYYKGSVQHIESQSGMSDWEGGPCYLQVAMRIYTFIRLLRGLCRPALNVIDIRLSSEIDLILGIPSYKSSLWLHALSKDYFLPVNIGGKSHNPKISWLVAVIIHLCVIISNNYILKIKYNNSLPK